EALNVTIGKLEMRFSWEESDAATSGSYNVDPRAAAGVPTRTPRLPTMPIQALEDSMPRDPHAPATIQHQASAPMGGPPTMMGGGPPPLSSGPPPMMGGGPPPLSGPPPMMGGGM